MKVEREPFCKWANPVGPATASEAGDLVTTSILHWRTRILDKLELAAATRPALYDLDLAALADHWFTTFEGSFLLSQAVGDSSCMRRQLVGRISRASRIIDRLGRPRALWSEQHRRHRGLMAHARHENVFIFAMLEYRRPGATAALHADHERIDEMQRAATEAVARAAASASATDGLHAYRLATELASAYLSHLLDEERTVMPAILECCSGEEIEACRRALLATVAPDEAAVTQRWVLLSLDHPTRVGLLTGARRSMPPEAFAGLLALAHQVLPAHDLTRLDAALTAAA